eukprot:COSAG01_NODE_30092_length_623_cov_0.765267_1_plen_202_part_01
MSILHNAKTLFISYLSITHASLPNISGLSCGGGCGGGAEQGSSAGHALWRRRRRRRRRRHHHLGSGSCGCVPPAVPRVVPRARQQASLERSRAVLDALPGFSSDEDECNSTVYSPDVSAIHALDSTGAQRRSHTTPSLVATPQQGRAATKQTTLDAGLPEHAERARHLARAMSDTPGVVTLTLPRSSNPATRQCIVYDADTT